MPNTLKHIHSHIWSSIRIASSMCVLCIYICRWNDSSAINALAYVWWSVHLSLSTVWLQEILHFKNQPCNRLYLEKPTGMHWLGYNDAVSWLNVAKTRIFQPTAYFENFKNLPVFRLPACQPAVRPGCARCRAPEISHDKGNGGGFLKMSFRRQFTHCAMAIPFILVSPSLFFFIPIERCESHLRRWR